MDAATGGERMSVKRPKRRNYDSEPDFLLACLRYLDAKFPGREGQRKRIAAWARWEREHTPDSLRKRLVELIDLDDWTAEDAAEFQRLAALWRERVRAARTSPDTTERNR